MSCDNKLSADIIFDCANKPKRGLDGNKAVLINFDDIDRAASTVSGATITDIVLKSGKSGFDATWYKDLANVNSAFAPNTEDIDGFTHSFLCRLPNSSAENAERAAEISQGRFIAVVETRFKGTDNADAFKVYGWEDGLKLSEMTNASNENSGSTPYTIATEEGDSEEYPYQIFLETDYATSKATFDTKFATV